MTPRRQPIKPGPASRPVDREKFRGAVRRLGEEQLFYLLDEAIDLLPPAALSALAVRHLRANVHPDATPKSLLETVQSFAADVRAGGYYEEFYVNSRNCMETSVATRAFLADCSRLLERCAAAATAGENTDQTLAAFELLFAVLRDLDGGLERLVFFADEGGSWQLPVDWPAVFPAWFGCLAPSVGPDEYASQVVSTVDAFEEHARAKHFLAARRSGSAAQRAALDARLAASIAPGKRPR